MLEKSDSGMINKQKYMLLIIATSTAFTGCMVGPNFHSPKLSTIQSYTDTKLPAHTVSAPVSGGASQYLIQGENIPAQWWYLFHSPIINALVTQGIKYNPNLDAAKAALCVAEENYNALFGSTYFPAVTAQFSAERQRFSDTSFGVSNQPPVTFNLFNASVNVSYTFDVFGGERRALEALQAQVNYQQFQLQAAYLTLTSNIVTTAVTIASLCDQIQATHELINAQQQQLQIVKKQMQLGGASLPM